MLLSVELVKIELYDGCYSSERWRAGHVSCSSHRAIRKKAKIMSSFYLQLLTGAYDIYLVKDYISEHCRYLDITPQ